MTEHTELLHVPPDGIDGPAHSLFQAAVAAHRISAAPVDAVSDSWANALSVTSISASRRALRLADQLTEQLPLSDDPHHSTELWAENIRHAAAS